MSHEMDIENTTKAVQTADLLLADLQELNRGGNALVSLLVLSEIEKIAEVKARLESILFALKVV